MNNDLEQFSEERLKQMVKFCETSIHGLPKHFEASEVAALARIALTAKQAKPVGYIAEVSGNRVGVLRGLPMPEIGSLIYTTPQPAHTEQAVPSEIPKVPHNGVMAYKKGGSIYSTNYARGWNDCRESMLAAAPKPESE